MNISHQDIQIIAECLKATAAGPFFPDWEFDSLMGIGKADFAAIVARWPDVDLRDEKVRNAVSNSLLNLRGYPIDDEEEWPRYISVPREDLDELRARFEKAARAS